MKNTDRYWERFGKEDPYYGVLSDRKYKIENLSPDHLQDFFRSGEDYIESLFQEIRRRVDATFSPTRALDFGCGVGRLTIPLSRRCKSVEGCDVSQSVLEEAKRNISQLGLENVFLHESDDNLSNLSGSYDFISSYVVFQHIPPARGMRIFERLVRRLADKGVCAIHMTYYGRRPWLRALLGRLRRHSGLANGVANIIEGNRFSYPHMEMNTYSLNSIVKVLQETGLRPLLFDFTDDGVFLAAIVIGQKAPRLQ